MYFYTHCLIGKLIGIAAFPHSHRLQAITIAASVAPDLVSTAYHVKKLFFAKSENKVFLREVSHSLPVFAFATMMRLIFDNADVINAILFGWGSHILIDILTHSNRQFKNLDTSYLYPFSSFGIDIKLGQELGWWDYRHPFMQSVKMENWKMFFPKIPEILICILCLLIIWIR